MPTSPLPVLIADDAVTARTAVVRALRGRGVPCLEAGTAAAAKAVDTSSISCALLDLDLGDGTGVEVARALLAAHPDLPVAFFSAGGAQDILAEARAIGPFFHKPEDIERAIAWVAGHASL
jgi:CheY-like chemotaxis protein